MLWVAFCGSWIGEGGDFKSYAGLYLFETGILSLCLSLSLTVRLALLFTVQKKIPPWIILPFCPTLVLSFGVHDVGYKQHKQTIRKVLVECRKEWQKAGT